VEDDGYKHQVSLLNAASMGVPQERERVLFISQMNDLGLPKLKLAFNKDVIKCKVIKDVLPKQMVENYKPSDLAANYWAKAKQGDSLSKVHPTGSWYNHARVSDNTAMPTLMGDGKFKLLHSTECRRLIINEWITGGTYPQDYNFLDIGG